MGLCDVGKGAGARILGGSGSKLDPGRGLNAHLRDRGIAPSGVRLAIGQQDRVTVSGGVNPGNAGNGPLILATTRPMPKDAHRIPPRPVLRMPARPA